MTITVVKGGHKTSTWRNPLLDIPEYHHPADECLDCPFTGPKVGSKGDPAAPIVFVAESPGAEEVKTKTPLSGPSGKIFHQFIPDSDEIYVLNAMECSPPTKLKDESRMEQAAYACRQRLLDKVAAHPRRIVVAMGNSAVRSLTGNHNLKITQIRGRLIPSEYAELGIFPIVHIAALMRGTGSFRQWKEDIQYAYELGLGASPKEHLKAELRMAPPAGYLRGQKWVDFFFEQLLRHTNELTCDIETSSLYWYNGRILTIGITPDHNKSVSYCFLPEHLQYLKKWFESDRISWCWQNGKFDVKFLRGAGIRARVDDDTMLLSYTLDESGGVHDLEQISADVLGAPDYKYMIQKYLKNKKTSYEVIPTQALAEYQAIDTSNTAQIRSIYRKRVARDSALEMLYTETLIPASELLTRVEMNGIQADPDRLKENELYYLGGTNNDGQYIEGELQIVQAEINEHLGYDINPGSPAEVSDALFRHFKFRNKYKGSTDAQTLDFLQEHTNGHPFIAAIKRYRTASRAYGTYVKGMYKWLQPDNRIHTNFKLHGTRTGRLSSNEPNIQNIPRVPQLRGTFIAAPGYELLEVDLSQAELRSLTALSGDPILIDIYLNNLDLHSDLAIFLFGEEWRDKYYKYPEDSPEYQWAKEKRVKCKNVNFGIIYGITKWGLCEQIKDTPDVAQAMLNGWFERYVVAGQFIEMCRDAPTKAQTIVTCFGRKKRNGLVSRANIRFLQNEAANFPHQSIASDITLTAAIICEPILSKMGVRIVNLVHDSIIMEVPITDDNHVRYAAAKLVAETLEQVPVDKGITRVPFVADAEYGDRWGTLHGFKDFREAA